MKYIFCLIVIVTLALIAVNALQTAFAPITTALAGL